MVMDSNVGERWPEEEAEMLEEEEDCVIRITRNGFVFTCHTTDR